MKYTQHKFALDVNQTASQVSISVKKGDTARRLLIHLTESGYPYHLSDECYAVFTAKKPDGHVIFNDCTIEDCAICYDFTPQTVPVAGLVECEIVLYGSDSEQLTSAGFYMIVEDTIYDIDTEIESTDEYNALAALIAEVQALKAHSLMTPPIIVNVAGELVSATDASNNPLQGLRIFGKSTQDGAPTPASPVEIVNVGAADGEIVLHIAGKNLFANSEMHAVDANGVEANNGAARRTPYIPVRPGQKLAFSKSEALPADSEPNGMLRMYDENRQFVTSMGALGYAGRTKVVTIPDGIYFVRFVQYGFTYIDGLEVQMEFAAAVTDYDGTEGHGLTVSTPDGLPGIPVTSGGNYIDSNGQQWICDEIDLGRDVYVQRIGTLDLSTISTWVRGTGNGWANLSAFHSSNAVPKAVPVGGYDTKAKIMCNRLIIETPGRVAGKIVNSVGQGMGASIYVSVEGIEKAEDLIAYFDENETVVRYALAEPIETALTAEQIAAYAALHTNKPNTTIYNDAGAFMAVEYVADTKTYIDNKGGSTAVSANLVDATVE